MTDYQKVAGGVPVASPDIVTADQTTIAGSGTAYDPLRVIGAGAPSVEHITGDGAASPTKDVTFCASGGASADITLADGTVDGFRKTFIFAADFDDATYTLTPAHFDIGGGRTRVQFPADFGGGIVLVWNASRGAWGVSGSYESTFS